MAFPVTPLDAVFELYAGWDWQDVTGDVYLRDGVTITRGRANEAPTADPGVCTLTLNNRHGKYSPRNPNSPYYGTLGRNSPLRVSIKDNEDDFNRVVVGGWGTTTAGDTWSSAVVGSPSLSVTGTLGRHEINAANSYALSYLPGRLYKDVDVKVKVKVPAGNSVTGGNLEPANIALRGESITDYFLVRVKVTSGFDVILEIRHETSGAVIAPEVLVDRIEDATEFTVRAQIEGQTIRAKAWDHTRTVSLSDPANFNPYEPLDWDIVGHTGDTYEGQKGWIGIRSGVATGNTNASPRVFEYDDLKVTIPRFVGEVSDWPVKWDVSGKDVYVPIQASGILRRLGQGNPALRSAMYRAMTNPDMTTPLGYWPCEDGADAAALSNAVPGGQPMLFAGGNISTVQRASYADFACSDPLPVFGGPQGTYLVGRVPLLPIGTSTLHAYMLMAVPDAGVSADCNVMAVKTTRGLSGTWSVDATTGGSLRLRVFDWLGNLVYTSSNIGFAVNGAPCMVVLSLDQSGSGGGATVDWTISVLKVGSPIIATGTGSVAGHDIGRPVSISVGLGGSTNGTAFGHVAVAVTDDTPLVLGTAYAALHAYTGVFPETHLARMIRLTTDEQLPFAYYGDAEDTELAGAQLKTPVLDILKQGAEADLGMLDESRGAAAVTYRTRTSMYNQTGLALDYAAGHVSPPLEPVDDDQLTRNDITVKRIGGASVQVSTDAGSSLSTQPPPDGVGRYDASVEVSLNSDDQLEDQGGWRLHLGTVDEARYPSVHVNLATQTGLIRDVSSLASGDRITLDNLPAWMPPELVDLIVVGYTEVLGTKSWDVTFNCLPGSPYQVLVLDDPNSRIGCHWMVERGSDGSNFAVLDTTDITFRISFDFANGGASSEVFTTSAGQMPIPMMVGGELMNITAVSGASPGVADITVTRSVNGVVKSHYHGTPVALARRPTIPL